MRKTIIALGTTVLVLVAEPLALAAVVMVTTFHAVLFIGHGMRPVGLHARTYDVYRYDFNQHTRESIGRITERRRRERENNYRDLLNLAKNIYAASTPNSLVFLSPD